MTKKPVLVTCAAALAVLCACGKKPPAIVQGSTVKMNYTLKVDGQVVDSSSGKAPLSYVQGSGQIISGLEEALSGLKAGDKKNVVVPPEKGYGLPDKNAIQKIPKKSFKTDKEFKAGDVISGQMNGEKFQALVTAADKTTVTVDFNHPLAGKILVFDVEIVEVTPPAKK